MIETSEINSRKMSDSSPKGQNVMLPFLLFFLLIPFFKTSGFEAISPCLAGLCNGMLAFEAAIFFILAFTTSRISAFSWAVLAFEVWDYAIAPLLSGSQPPSLFYLSDALGIILLLDLGCRHNFTLVLNTLSFTFTAFVVINFILLLLKPSGLAATSNGNVYLFGIRTGSSLVIIPALAFCIFDDSVKRRKYFSFRTMLCMICSVSTLVLQWVATGIVELLIIFVFYFLIRHSLKFKPNIWVSLLVAGLLDYAIVYLRVQNIFYGLVVVFLHKDLTLTGRTYIWDAVIREINKHPIFGYGLDNSVMIFNVQKACHNQWLYLTHESGYIGLALFIFCILVSFRSAHRYRKSNLYKIFVIIESAILIATISEIQLYVPFFYVLLCFPMQWKYAGEIEKTTIPAFPHIPIKWR